MESQAERVIEVCKQNNMRDLRATRDSKERDLIWKSRKRAFGALGRLSPNYYTQDGVVPRTRLPDIMRVIKSAQEKYDLVIGNVFHAGDGNIHPCICYDENDPVMVKKVVDASSEILKACIEMGGSVTGEHGIGAEKIDFMPLLFSEDDMQAMENVKYTFDEANLCNPGKVFPTDRSCIGCGIEELKAMKRQAAM